MQKWGMGINQAKQKESIWEIGGTAAPATVEMISDSDSADVRRTSGREERSKANGRHVIPSLPNISDSVLNATGFTRLCAKYQRA